MIFEKGEKHYQITECERHWSIVWASGAVSATFRVDKELCPTYEKLKAYINENAMF